MFKIKGKFEAFFFDFPKMKTNHDRQLTDLNQLRPVKLLTINKFIHISYRQYCNVNCEL